MHVAKVLKHLLPELLRAPHSGRRCSAIFEKLRKHIHRQEKEIERLRRELTDAQKKLVEDEKEIARHDKKLSELEKENSRLKRDLESKAPPANNGSLSTPSAMQPAYSKPSAPKRRRKPGRKKGHPGACRPAPVRIDQTVEHTLSQCPICGSTELGKPCGKHIRIIEDIPPVQPVATEHVYYEYYCPPCDTKVL